MNLIMKMLAVPAAVVALWAVNAQATTNDDIAKRLEPVGKVCVQGQECKGMEVTASVVGGHATTTAYRSSHFHPFAFLPLNTDFTHWLKTFCNVIVRCCLSVDCPKGHYCCWYGQHFHN